MNFLSFSYLVTNIDITIAFSLVWLYVMLGLYHYIYICIVKSLYRAYHKCCLKILDFRT